ncbi:MAG: undecaprenyl-diphosphate phosphatase [Acidimicrobiales bacterium]
MRPPTLALVRSRPLLGAVAVGLILLTLTGSTLVKGDSTGRVESLTTPKAIVLGVVEGITEYLPISSTGHLLVTEKVLDVGQHKNDKDPTDTYTVVIQIGAILAVLGIFRKRFVLMLEGLVGRSEEGRSLILSLLLAFVPAVVIAVALQDPIKERLLKPWPVVVAWVVGGIAILLFVANSSKLRVRIESVGAITPRVALGIGVAQVLALWPGTSRSLVTILAALLLGCSLTAAVEFSFLLGFLTLSAATAYELLKHGSEMVDAFGIVNPLIGIVVAGIAAFASVKWMITYLEKHPLTIFAHYRFAAAVLTGVLLVTKAI